MLNRLKRITSSGNYIAEIDGLRFIAISSVVLFHMLGELQLRSGRVIAVEANSMWLYNFIANGERGVRLFFVISGMILAMPFAREFLLEDRHVSLSRYYLRRLTRLEPPFVLSIFIAVALIASYQHGFDGLSLGHLVATLTYQHNLVFGQSSNLNPVTWSLETEIQFYVSAPLFMQVYRIRSATRRRGLLLALICSISLAQLLTVHSMRFDRSIFNYIQYFLGGLLIADLCTTSLPRWPSHRAWDIAGVFAIVLTVWIPSYRIGHAVLPLVFGVLFLAAMKGITLRKVLALPWIAVTGGMCYSIYLLHFLLIAVLFKLTKHAILTNAPFFVNYAIQLLLVIPIAFALCALFFLTVERPCMDPAWPQKLKRRLVRDRVCKEDPQLVDPAS